MKIKVKVPVVIDVSEEKNCCGGWCDFLDCVYETYTCKLFKKNLRRSRNAPLVLRCKPCLEIEK